MEAEGVDEEKQQMLWQLVEECGSELSSGERRVLSSSAHICGCFRIFDLRSRPDRQTAYVHMFHLLAQ